MEITWEGAAKLLAFEEGARVLGALMGFESDTTGPAECTLRERFRTPRHKFSVC